MIQTQEVLIVAGEDSGDTLGSEIMRELAKKTKQLTFFGVGGPKMKKLGLEQIYSTEATAIVGLVEVLKAVPRVWLMFRRLKRECRQRNVSWAILVDFPGFNLPLAKRLHKIGVRCIQVVSPQIWAWHYSRIHKIRRVLDTVLCLYDFEVDMYQKENVNAEFMGHPLARIVQQSKAKFANKKPRFGDGFDKTPRSRIVALLPGSRRSEVSKNFPFMLEIATILHENDDKLIFRVPIANERAGQLMREHDIPDYISLTEEGTHAVLATSTAALACSGTVTLECALFELPFLLVYQSSALSFWIGKRVVRIPYVGMANVIYGDFINKELLQDDMKAENVLPEMRRLIYDQPYRKEMKGKFATVRKRLGATAAGARAAKLIANRMGEG